MDNIIEKSLSGIYEDNPLNRKLGRVGQKYDHSSGHIVIDSILISFKENINKMISSTVKSLQDQYDKEGNLKIVSASEAEYIRLGIISDMSIALSKYIKPTDKLIEAKSSNFINNLMTVNITINRDGENIPLRTDVIFAGGYNIQKLHYRYITKTKLPLLSNDDVKKAYKEKIAKLTKAEKILSEIDYFQKLIDKESFKIEESKTITESEILNRNKYYSDSLTKVTWSDIVNRGADANFDYKEENFLKSQEEFKQNIIDRYWKSISFSKTHIVDLMKSKVKNEQKLKAL